MKRILLLALAILAISPAMMAGDKKKKAKKEAPAEAVASDKEIHWMTMDEVQVAMKKKPKKVFVDVYTDWCGWCKVMDKKTFSNPEVIKYVNQNFYAVKFNAEQKDSLRFNGKMYGFSPEMRANTLAVELLNGQLSYPTSVVLEENFANPQAIPGYLDVKTIEKILKYIAGNVYKTKAFPDFDKEFVSTWNDMPAPPPTTPTSPMISPANPPH